MRKSFVAWMKCNEIQEEAYGLRHLVLKMAWLNETCDNEDLILIFFQPSSLR
jgi:hypothetical protein